MNQFLAIGTALCIWGAANSRAGEPGAGAGIPAPTVTLEATRAHYDAERPSTARLKCMLRNATKEAVDVPVGYDGRLVRLHSALMTLELARRRGDARGAPPGTAIRLVRVPPGGEAVVFDFALDAILLKEDKANEPWRWEWPRRSAPPRSPLRPRAGIAEQLMFPVEVMLGKQRVVSNFAVLNVKRRTPPPKTQHDIVEAE
jgi:hypothetical protein